MTFLELQDYFIKYLKEKPTYDKNNLPDYEIMHIIAIVKYIDEVMDLNNECISMVGAINNMRRIIKDIHECSTGVTEIDNVAYKRMRDYIEKYDSLPEGKDYIFYEEPPYVENIVSILSQYGGLYKYVASHTNNSLIDKNWESVFQSEHYARIHHL